MNRNAYDTDVTVWSPQGRLFQVEYAMEAVKQGSACVGAVSDAYAVLACLKRSSGELAMPQKKVFEIDCHVGAAISGLTSDARSLCRYMRVETVDHRYVYDSPLRIARLVRGVADKHQWCTQSYVRRPYGVGLLIAGCDDTGPHLFQTCPSGNYWEYKAMAIGARSQSAKTYLERHFEEFPGLDRDALIGHALRALAGCTETEQELTANNTSIAFVGKGVDFTILDGDAVVPYLDALSPASAEDAAHMAAARAREADEDAEAAARRAAEAGAVDIGGGGGGGGSGGGPRGDDEGDAEME